MNNFLNAKKNSVFHGRQSLCLILSLSIEFFNWGSHRLTTRVSLNFEDCDTLTIPRKSEHMPPWTHAFNMCTHIGKCSKFQLKRQHYLSIQKELRWNVFVSLPFAFLACPFFFLFYLIFCHSVLSLRDNSRVKEVIIYFTIKVNVSPLSSHLTRSLARSPLLSIFLFYSN